MGLKGCKGYNPNRSQQVPRVAGGYWIQELTVAKQWGATLGLAATAGIDKVLPQGLEGAYLLGARADEAQRRPPSHPLLLPRHPSAHDTPSPTPPSRRHHPAPVSSRRRPLPPAHHSLSCTPPPSLFGTNVDMPSGASASNSGDVAGASPPDGLRGTAPVAPKPPRRFFAVRCPLGKASPCGIAVPTGRAPTTLTYLSSGV